MCSDSPEWIGRFSLQWVSLLLSWLSISSQKLASFWNGSKGIESGSIKTNFRAKRLLLVPQRTFQKSKEASPAAATLQEEITRYRQQPDGEAQVQGLLDRYRKRMYDISVFIKELKGRFAQWYNQRHDRYGVLWAERFKSVLLEGGEALAAVAAYIELNPVRAGLCDDPKDYRYSGYAEAFAKGSLLARQGIKTSLGQPETISGKELSGEYRKYLFVKGSFRSANKPPAFDLATAQCVVEEQNGEIPLPQRLLCRIRYFTDGVILGSQGFVESHFGRLKQKLGYKRHRAATSLTALGSPALWVLRDLRVRAFD